MGALVIVTAFSLVYALYQKTEAAKLMQLAEANAQRAIETDKKANNLHKQMHAFKMEAERQKQIAEECARSK